MQNKNKRVLANFIVILIISIISIIVYNYIQYNTGLNKSVEVEESEYKPTTTPTAPTSITETPSAVVEENKEDVVLSEVVKSYQSQYNNPEIVGRIYIPGTIIDYPIAQRKEDTENYYYLKNDYYGNYDVNGSIYLDYENDFANHDKNTIIYGHNMAENKMFHSIRYFQDKNYFDKHKYVFIETLTETRVYENFAWMKPDISFQYLTVNFRNDEEYAALQQGILDRSIYPINFELTTDDSILSLSTCDLDTSNDNYRFVLTSVLKNTYPIGAEIPELSQLGE